MAHWEFSAICATYPSFSITGSAITCWSGFDEAEIISRNWKETTIICMGTFKKLIALLVALPWCGRRCSRLCALVPCTPLFCSQLPDQPCNSPGYLNSAQSLRWGSKYGGFVVPEIQMSTLYIVLRGQRKKSYDCFRGEIKKAWSKNSRREES